MDATRQLRLTLANSGTRTKAPEDLDSFCEQLVICTRNISGVTRSGANTAMPKQGGHSNTQLMFQFACILLKLTHPNKRMKHSASQGRTNQQLEEALRRLPARLPWLPWGGMAATGFKKTILLQPKGNPSRNRSCTFLVRLDQPKPGPWKARKGPPFEGGNLNPVLVPGQIWRRTQVYVQHTHKKT